MTRAALLARVSSSAQSADMQLAELRAVAAHRKWNVVLEETDVGSGSRADLPGRARVIAAARAGNVDVVAVWRLDRLGRSLKDLIEISAVLQRSHVELVSLRDAVETGTPAGQLLFSVLGAIAQFERDLIGERVRAGLANARARGVVVGRPRTFVQVDFALALRDRGWSTRRVARKLGVSARTLERAFEARRAAAIAETADARAQILTARGDRARQKPPSRRPSKRTQKRPSRARAAVRGRK